MNKLDCFFNLGLVAFLYSLFSCQVAFADDSEVFFAGVATATSSNPNVLFIIDTSGSMNSNQTFTEVDELGNTVTVSQSRIGILQDVMSEIMAKQAGVNMGLSRFSVPGGPILFPVTNPNELTDPIVLRSLSTANDDAIQSNNTVTLNSDYLDPVVSGNGAIIGLRFEDVRIPQGANITHASLLLSTDIDSLEPGASYEIYAEIVPNAVPFEASVNNLSNRISGQFVNWSAEPWDAEPILNVDRDPPTTFETPNISSVLQQVIALKGATLLDPAGWCGGNDLVILLKKTSSNGRPILAYDKNSSFSPKLRVDFDSNIPESESGCYANTLVKQVSNDSHDSESGSGGLTDTSLDLYKDNFYNENNASVAVSFENVAIPQGSKVSDARLKFISRSTSPGNAKTTIYAVNSATPPTNSTTHGSTNLTAGIEWNIEPWDFGVSYSSVNIATIVESVFGLDGPIEARDISFLLKGSAGNRNAYSFSSQKSRAPILEITYKGRYDPSLSTKRGAMIAAIEDFKANGNTPISDTFAEAALYFKGEAVTYGMVRGSPAKSNNRISHIDSTTNGVVDKPDGCTVTNPSGVNCKDEKFLGTPVYQSPIMDACQANHIVLLTDGAPTSHNLTTNAIYEKWTQEISGTAGNCATGDNGKDCTIKMAGLLRENDVLPGTDAKEAITTHTIGFFSDQAFLQDIADAGGGTYATAYDKQQLIDAINEIVGAIIDVNTTFSSAGVSVNQYNRLTHNDELYFSLFSPSPETVWPGNIKRYRLFDGRLVDVNGNNAVGLEGEFNPVARSWWSSGVDGNEIELGGTAEQLTNNRQVFSDLTSTADLTALANRLEPTNVLISEAMIGAASTLDKETILNWVVGKDVNNTNDPTLARKNMGDPNHSQPTILIYRDSASTFRSSIYVGTNAGFLHSFNSVNGQENWSFIPQELLGRLSEIQKDTQGAHTYGLDGSVTLYIDDVDGAGNQKGVVDPGEKAYLYIGMRRGGTNYYALDVSEFDRPKLLFKINSSGDYSGLGQTWSKPLIEKMNIFPDHETVMIFGGGYDTQQDDPGTASKTDLKGNNIYIADALTGELLWDISDAIDASGIAGSSAGSLTTMNGVPGAITAFDFSGDEFIDHFYAADTKAQVFRFDVNSSSAKITGGRVAHMQNIADEANNRRFYNSPDIALVRLTSGSFVSISIGSGYRAHPLDETVIDHFYMIKDKGILDRRFDMDVALSDLVDVTNLIGDGDGDGVSDAAALINDELDPKNGWFVSFPRSGEKVISDSVTFNNAVIFTSYTPPSVNGGACSAVAGTSRIYGMKITDGNPYLDTNFDGQLTEIDRAAQLSTSGIAPTPQVLLEGTDTGVKARLCVGNQCGLDAFLPDPPDGVMGIRWRKN